MRLTMPDPIKLIDWLDQHVKAHGVKYVAGLVAAAFFGSWATGFAAKALDDGLRPIVIAQVQKEISPVKEELRETKAIAQQSANGITELLKQSYSREIIEIQTLLCKSPGDPRLLHDLNEAKDKYKKVAGEHFQTPDCNILVKR